MGPDLPRTGKEDAALQGDETAPERALAGSIESFEYADSPGALFVPSWNGWEEAPDAASAQPRRDSAIAGADRADLNRLLAEEARRSFESGRARGIEEGRRQEREAHGVADAAREKERFRQAAELVAKFAAERDRYFLAVEREVVKLALAVAARILRREAQIDPLLLMGAVRAALGQLAASLEVKLRVPAAELSLWTEAIALVPHLPAKPAVLAGEGMRLGDCAIETSMGSVDLGVRAQLAEIERGFFDRPAAPQLRAEDRAPERAAESAA